MKVIPVKSEAIGKAVDKAKNNKYVPSKGTAFIVPAPKHHNDAPKATHRQKAPK